MNHWPLFLSTRRLHIFYNESIQFLTSFWEVLGLNDGTKLCVCRKNLFLKKSIRLKIYRTVLPSWKSTKLNSLKSQINKHTTILFPTEFFLTFTRSTELFYYFTVFNFLQIIWLSSCGPGQILRLWVDGYSRRSILGTRTAKGLKSRNTEIFASWTFNGIFCYYNLTFRGSKNWISSFS